MKKKNKILLFIPISLIAVIIFFGYFIVERIFDVPVPSTEEFNVRREKYEFLVEKSMEDNDIDSVEKKTKYFFKPGWDYLLNDFEVNAYTLKINSDFVKLEGHFYVSRKEKKKYDKKHIDEYLTLMDELDLFWIDEQKDISSVGFFKNGKHNKLYGYGYMFILTGDAILNPRIIEEKINDNWYIIAIFN